MKARHEFPTDETYADYLRHYYAGIAMNGLLSKGDITEMSTTEWKGIFRDSVEAADALIEQLSKP